MLFRSDGYISSNGLGTREDEEIIYPTEAENEYIMLGMRLTRGIDICEYENKFNKDFYKSFGKKFEKFSPEFVLLSENNCKFTEKGMFISNYILSEILDF